MTDLVDVTNEDPRAVHFVCTELTRDKCEQVHALLCEEAVALEERIVVLARVAGRVHFACAEAFPRGHR